MKTKASCVTNIPHKHLQSRISYLHQAAAYLTNYMATRKDDESDLLSLKFSTKVEQRAGDCSKVALSGVDNVIEIRAPTRQRPGDEVQRLSRASPLARHLLSHLRGVALKVQAQLSPSLKHSMCKRCEAFLIPGITSTNRIENRSNGGRKPWADVLVITCNACKSSKRFPIGAKRQARKTKREEEQGAEIADEAVDPELPYLNAEDRVYVQNSTED